MIVVMLLFGFGFISCIAGVIRTYYMYEVTTGWDQTWRSYPVWVTSALELYIGIVSLNSFTLEIFTLRSGQYFGQNSVG